MGVPTSMAKTQVMRSLNRIPRFVREIMRIGLMLLSIAFAVAAVSAVMAILPHSIRIYDWFVKALIVLMMIELFRLMWRGDARPVRRELTIPPSGGESDDGSGGAGVFAKLPPQPTGPLVGAAAKSLPRNEPELEARTKQHEQLIRRGGSGE